MHRDLCHGKEGLCDTMKPTKGTTLLQYLRKVDFKGERFLVHATPRAIASPKDDQPTELSPRGRGIFDGASLSSISLLHVFPVLVARPEADPALRSAAGKLGFSRSSHSCHERMRDPV